MPLRRGEMLVMKRGRDRMGWGRGQDPVESGEAFFQGSKT